jgi:DNA-binding NarL/FixJ family response regulator
VATHSEGSIRVVIADDVEPLRVLLRAQLELDDAFEVVGEAADGRAAVAVAQETQPDCVLLDLAMPVMDGLQAIPEIQRVAPAAKIVVLSGFEAVALETAALDAGADLFLEKSNSLTSVAETLRDMFHPIGTMRRRP